jgi:hypothetical protein
MANILDFNVTELKKEELEALKPLFHDIKANGTLDPFKIHSCGMNSEDPRIQEHVHELVRKKILSFDGLNRVSLASPAVLQLVSLKPSVFISHAHSDKQNIYDPIAVLQSINVTVVCSSDDRTAAMMSESQKDISIWEKEQIDMILSCNHFIWL